MLWNIRKKKFIAALVIAFVIATVDLALPAFLNVGHNPYFAATFRVEASLFSFLEL